jgi:hypothetical protein
MAILRDVTINLTAEELLAAQGRDNSRLGLIAVAEEAVALGQTLFAPAAIYDEFGVHGVTGERVELAVDHAGLTVGPKSHLLAPARRLLVVVCTIGPALEARVGELYGEGEPLLSYMLDCVGVMALGVVGERMRRLAEEQAAGRGWGVSPSLGPGSLVGWPVQGQRELCALLPLADIGVRLSKYCVLEPHKSASMAIGLGPGYESHEVGSVCRYCALRDTCWRRREGKA